MTLVYFNLTTCQGYNNAYFNASSSEVYGKQQVQSHWNIIYGVNRYQWHGMECDNHNRISNTSPTALTSCEIDCPMKVLKSAQNYELFLPQMV